MARILAANIKAMKAVEKIDGIGKMELELTEEQQRIFLKLRVSEDDRNDVIRFIRELEQRFQVSLLD